MAMSPRNPYPGPRPFEASDQDVFFGRAREVMDLVSLVIAHRVLLLYAKSGAGKTSLLNAGVIPTLGGEGFDVLPVTRVGGTLSDGVYPADVPNVYVFNAIMGWSADMANPKALVGQSIADFLQTRPHRMDELSVLLPRLIVFDQFEELISIYPGRWNNRAGFFQQIAAALEADPLLHVLFAAREDYVAALEPYEWFLPEQLGARYRLELLREPNAILALEEPLKKVGKAFAPGVAKGIIRELLTIRAQDPDGKMIEILGEFVEPVQLQVICQSLWLDLPPDVQKITAEHVRAFGDVDAVLTSFYDRAIEKATHLRTRISEATLRKWFDQNLITTDGTRSTVFRGKERTGGIPNTVVDALENYHLLRAEMRAGGRWYELTHDRFIKPIKSSNYQWRTALQRRQTLLIILIAVGIALICAAYPFLMVLIANS